MAMFLEATVQAVVAQVVAALVHEGQYVFNFKSEFEQMEKGLKKLEDYLKDADQNLNSENIQTIKSTLKDLREVVYDADNAAIDCLIRKLNLENRPMIIRSCLMLGDPLFRHGMGRRLKEINTRIQGVESGLLKYLPGACASSGSNSNSISNSNSGGTSMSEHDRREVAMSQNFCGHATYGLDDDIAKLKGMMLDHEEEPVNYVGIVGMGGLGKTTITQILFQQVSSNFDKTMWVCVSKKFSEERIMQMILERVNVSISPADKSDMLGTITRVLKDQSYLIVLDDVWPNENKPHWLKDLCSKLPIPDGRVKKSCILITTRFTGVAQIMAPRPKQIHHHKPLNEKHSLKLFSESAFRATKGVCPNPQLEDGTKRILKQCGGLPLAIKTVGSFLSHKVDSPSEWNDISKKFHVLTTEGNNKEVISCLRLSYDELPLTSLKQCLLCVSIYPEDFVIDTEQLIHWWVGEGLVFGNDRSKKTAKEVGYEYLAELVNRCLVEAVERREFDGRVYKCKIHDMVREMIIQTAEEEAFCSFDGKAKPTQEENRRWLCFSDDTEMEENDKKMEKNDKKMEKNDKRLKDNPKLRTFFLMSNPPNDFGSNFRSLESLRVLDLSYSKLEDDKSKSTTSSPVFRVKDIFSYVSSLKRLACLNLSGAEELTEVPSSVKKLLNLQLLVLSRCKYLTKVDPSITRLKRLIVLNLGNCNVEYLPRGLGELSALQELTGFRVRSKADEAQGCALAELGQLKELRVVQIVLGADSEISQDEMKVLSGLKMLKVVDIDADKCTRKEKLSLVDRLELPPQLKELYLRNYHSERVPNWLHPKCLPSLRYLCVENSKINSLTNDKSTWTIEGLCLKLLSFEVEWESLKQTMPALRCMEITKCINFHNFPCSVFDRGVWSKED